MSRRKKATILAISHTYRADVRLSANAGIPILSNTGTLVGVISAGYRLDQLTLVDRVKKLYGADCTMFLGDVRIATTIEQDGKRVVGTQLDPNIAKVVLGEGKVYHGQASILGMPYLTAYMPLVGSENKNIGVLFAGQSTRKAEEAMSRTKLVIGCSSILVLMLSIAVMFLVIRRITVPLSFATEQLMGQLSSGNFSVTIPENFLKRNDEIGSLAKAMETLTRNIRGLLSQIASSAEQVAASSAEMTASSEQVADAADGVVTSVIRVAQSSSKQVEEVNETSAVVQEISASLQEVAATAAEMAMLAEKTARATQEGQTSVDKAVNQMSDVGRGAQGAQKAAEDLKAGSRQIGEIVVLISSIAGQTNLLALNAAIEAARAGEQGRGFAVVADEVRKLAEQSAEAARQITGLIGNNNANIDQVVVTIDAAISDVEQGVELVNVAGGNFREIGALVAQVTDQVRNISTALQEAAVGSQRIVGSIKEVENLSREVAVESESVAAASEEQSASMLEIAASSQALEKLAASLQSAISKFRI